MNLWHKLWWKVEVDTLTRRITFTNSWKKVKIIKRLSDWDVIHLTHRQFRKGIINKHFNWINK
ncbi:MAG: hypothetical protein DRQ44_16485 [Gammaproteobacteria bacterium]|nr:MAG: hypothetical protein DRQ44_16485 [Gammaproteobacteria bacterium]